MAAFNFAAPKGAGTYTDSLGVVWTIHATPDELLAGEWTADTAASSRYGVVSLWGPAKSLKGRIDAYAAGYAVAPPAAAVASSSWLWLVVIGVVLLSDSPKR